MCFQEFIVYQCGHRSLAVVRPCPITTTGHNFPICRIQPFLASNALTMCAPCERTLHSRWVLIREWEHRWLHERGVCGCDVVFPGLLTRPRVIGGDPDPGSSSTTANKYNNNNTDDNDSAQTDPRLQPQPQPHTSNTVPALYKETSTGGERHVAIRLPSLYAAEWLGDHRQLHRDGRCQCPADFHTFQPEVDERDLNPEERGFLRGYRELENMNQALDSEKIAQRAVQVGNIFAPSPALAVAAGPSAAASQNPAPAHAGDQGGEIDLLVHDMNRILTASSSAPPGSLGPDTSSSSSSSASTRWNTQRQTIPDPLGQYPITHGPGPFLTAAIVPTLPVVPEPGQDGPEEETLPICGLPIGAGPEGESHMPSFNNCRLSRPVPRRRNSNP
ncbi:hypothetical protein B0T22DRAFT_506711 [Podospora appendiculata]|uniref:Uncharacterized protein n=1 Tax=Podospora appendiculata TaxID=314037 RepID=A0AAE1CH10_9PEZI|nr:hypothetical protein B0T22DRAFT_506711 [Podospora appendiculata]